MQTQQSQIDEELIERASRMLAELLRHTPKEYNITLNNRGWASEKDVRRALATEFDSVTERKGSLSDKTGSVELILAIMDQDDENRFQRINEDKQKYGLIRATRKHSVDNVTLVPVEPSDDDLQYYVVTYGDGSEDYIESTSKDAAEHVLADRLRQSREIETITLTETDPYYDVDASEGRPSDSLNGDGPDRIIHQDGRKPLTVERRGNMATNDKGRYFKKQPYRVTERLSTQ